MRSGTATTRRVRLVIVLSVAAAVTVVIGAILMAMHQPAHMSRLGLDVAVAGVAFGVVVLVMFVIGRIGRTADPGCGRAGRITGAEPPAPSPWRPPAGAAGTPGATAQRVPGGRPC